MSASQSQIEAISKRPKKGSSRPKRKQTPPSVTTLWDQLGLRFDGHELSPIITAILLAAPVLAAAIFYVWTHVATVRLGYALTEAAHEHKALVEENRGLRIETAALKRPGRLERLAAEKYQLSPPLAGQIVYVERAARKDTNESARGSQ